MDKNNETIKELIDTSDKLVVLNFKASWCGPCKVMSPIIDEVIATHSDVADIIKIDIDEDADLSNIYKIRSVPTTLFVKNNEVLSKVPGIMSKSMLIDNININK